MKSPVLIAASLAIASLAMSGAAKADAKLGLLSCQSDGAVGYVVGSTKEYLCVFKPASSALPQEAYVGTLDTVGVDLGITGRQDLSWAVYAENFERGNPVSLEGRYYGVSADASVAAGGGAKALVGGTANGYTLQSLSLQAQFGLNATVGVSRLTLEPAPTDGAVYKN